jgi:hypothetical protein
MSHVENSHSGSHSDVESQNNDVVVNRTSLVQWVRTNPRKAAGIIFGGVAVTSCIIGLAVGLAGAKQSAAAARAGSSGSGSEAVANPSATDPTGEYGVATFSVSCNASGSSLTVSGLPAEATCVIRTDTFERGLVEGGVVTFEGVTDLSSVSFGLYTASSGEFDCSGEIGEAQCEN